MKAILFSRKGLVLLSLTSLLFVMTTFTTVTAGGTHKAKPSKVGVVTYPQVLEAGCHFSAPPCYGDGDNAGAIITAKVKFSGYSWPRWLNYKKATITTSTSWDWDSYDPTNHPCALINIVSRDINRAGQMNSLFQTDATVIIEVPYKGTIHGIVRGGSVCELYENGQYTLVNEGMTAFEVDPEQSTGKFYGATGTGSIRSSAEQVPNGQFVFNEVYLNLHRPQKY